MGPAIVDGQEVDGRPPMFMMWGHYGEMWDAWAQLQRQRADGEIRGKGWRVWKADSFMGLEIGPWEQS